MCLCEHQILFGFLVDNTIIREKFNDVRYIHIYIWKDIYIYIYIYIYIERERERNGVKDREEKGILYICIIKLLVYLCAYIYRSKRE